MPLAEATRTAIARLRDRYPHPRSAILPSLWAVQNELGYISSEGMEEVATLLGLRPSEVAAVRSFYSMYFDRPAGRHFLLVCVNVACALRGADETVSYLEEKLGCPSGGTTADGSFTWESTIECLGGCGGAPMMQIDHHFHENLTPDRIDAILERVAGEPHSHGDGHGRAMSEPRHPSAQTPPPPTAEGPPSDAPMPDDRPDRLDRPGAKES